MKLKVAVLSASCLGNRLFMLGQPMTPEVSKTFLCSTLNQSISILALLFFSPDL